MASYQLKVLFDKDTVETFNQLARKVVIVKETGGIGAKVAWVTFSPFEINNVAWAEQYGLYSSCSEVSGSAKISKSSYTEASEKQSYTFANGVFEAPKTDGAIGDNTYKIVNAMKDPNILTFGLAQDVVANGVNYEGNPINAVQVVSNESATFTPHEVIQIFMHSNMDDGMVISDTTTQPLQLDFAKQANITIKYDPDSGRFVTV